MTPRCRRGTSSIRAAFVTRLSVQKLPPPQKKKPDLGPAFPNNCNDRSQAFSGTFGTEPRPDPLLPGPPFGPDGFGLRGAERLAFGRLTGIFSGFGVTGPSRY